MTLRTGSVCLKICACLVLAACHGSSVAPFEIVPRYWMQAEASDEALASAVQHVRASVARSFADGVLKAGFPRDCTVTEPEDRTVPFTAVCVEGGAAADGLLLDSDGRFIQFVPIDFLSARAFLFEVYLIPDAATAARLTPEALLVYPHVAIPHFQMSESTYRQWLSAIMRGIRAAGAEPF